MYINDAKRLNRKHMTSGGTRQVKMAKVECRLCPGVDHQDVGKSFFELVSR